MDLTMLSRSSSSYQPLETPSTSNGNKSKRRRRPSEEFVTAAPEIANVEMTNIAVVSQHPFCPNGVPTTVICHEDTSDLNVYRQADKESSWTNFHFVMCIGIVGFFIFWIVLLMRMYAPPKLRLW